IVPAGTNKLSRARKVRGGLPSSCQTPVPDRMWNVIAAGCKWRGFIPPGSYSTSYTATSRLAVLGSTIFNSGGCEITPLRSWLPVEAVANRNANPATAKAPAFGREFMAPLLLVRRIRQTSSADGMASTRRGREKALPDRTFVDR